MCGLGWRSGSGSSHAGRRQLWLQSNTKRSTPPLYTQQLSVAVVLQMVWVTLWQITKHPSWLLHLCSGDGGEQEEKHPDKFTFMGGPFDQVIQCWYCWIEGKAGDSMIPSMLNQHCSMGNWYLGNLVPGEIELCGFNTISPIFENGWKVTEGDAIFDSSFSWKWPN